MFIISYLRFPKLKEMLLLYILDYIKQLEREYKINNGKAD